MSQEWIRVPPEPRDTLAVGVVASVVAAGVGLATFYLLRTFLAREPLKGSPPPGPLRERRDDGGRGA